VLFEGFDVLISKKKKKILEKKIILMHFQLKSTLHHITKHMLVWECGRSCFSKFFSLENALK